MTKKIENPTVTVVIPTLWGSPRLVKQLQEYCDWESCREIILVDNAVDKSMELPDCEKIKVIRNEQNRYVNPAWNQGVAASKGKHLLIVNDDVSFNPRLLDAALRQLRPRQVLGCSTDCFEPNLINSGSFEISALPWDCMNQGWGCIMLMHRMSYPRIPEELLIYCGDDWISNSLQPLKMRLAVETDMSTSSGRSEFSVIKDNDINHFHTNYRTFAARIAYKLNRHGFSGGLRLLSKLTRRRSTEPKNKPNDQTWVV